MKLSTHSAKQIVKEINEIVHMPINLMNPEGIIIASTNDARVGTFHEAAKRIIDEGLDNLVVSDYDQYRGAHPGQNYPIIVDDEIIGVIGITGAPEVTAAYARIVKHMTEIFVRELKIMEDRAAGESIRNHFLDEWLHGDSKKITQDFLDQGKLLGIDITIPRRIMAIDFWTRTEETVDQLLAFDAAGGTLKKLVHELDSQALSLKTASSFIIAVTYMDNDHLLTLAKKIQSHIQAKHSHVLVAIGLDSGEDSGGYLMAPQACVKATKALLSCMRTHKFDIRFFDDINMEIFANEISNTAKIEYINKIFHGMSAQMLTETIQLLELLYDCEGSINAVAQRLYLHKNTVQNKLLRIRDITGYDPRSIRHSSLFYIAIYFYRDVKDAISLSMSSEIK